MPKIEDTCEDSNPLLITAFGAQVLIKGLKKGKVPGPDSITSEMLNLDSGLCGRNWRIFSIFLLLVVPFNGKQQKLRLFSRLEVELRLLTIGLYRLLVYTVNYM